jgi:hypothetical protein
MLRHDARYPQLRISRQSARSATVTGMDILEVLGLDDLLAQFVLAIGAAMWIGNAFALYQNKRGRSPKGVDTPFNAGRAWWLLGVGVLISLWGLISIFAS